MSELTVEQFVRMVAQILEAKGCNITLSNPDTNESYPIGVISAPLETINMTDENNIPIKKYFEISIEWWDDGRYDSLKLHDECEVIMREYNFIMVGSLVTRYDDVTKKHITGGTYQVAYNGLTNSLEKIK